MYYYCVEFVARSCVVLVVRQCQRRMCICIYVCTRIFLKSIALNRKNKEPMPTLPNIEDVINRKRCHVCVCVPVCACVYDVWVGWWAGWLGGCRFRRKNRADKKHLPPRRDDLFSPFHDKSQPDPSVICEYKHTHTHAHANAHMHTHTHTHMHTRTHAHTCTHTHTLGFNERDAKKKIQPPCPYLIRYFTYLDLYVCTCVCVCARNYVLMSTCEYIHKYAHTGGYVCARHVSRGRERQNHIQGQTEGVRPPAPGTGKSTCLCLCLCLFVFVFVFVFANLWKTCAKQVCVCVCVCVCVRARHGR